MIIGVTGTNGAGKGAVVEYLVTKGFKHYSARDFIVEEIKRRGLEVNRVNMGVVVGNDLRKNNGPAFIISSLYERAVKEGGNAVLESIRNLGEAEFLKSNGASLLCIDAERKIRYERAILRGSATDKVSFEEFCVQEDAEMSAVESHAMNMLGVMALADYTLQNNGSLEVLHAQVDAVLAKIG